MAAAVSSIQEPRDTTCTSAALLTVPTSEMPRRAIIRSRSGTPASRYLAGRRSTAIARITRPARHSPIASAAMAPTTVSDTPPSAGSRQPPADTRSTLTRSAAPALGRRRVGEQPPFDFNGCVLPREILALDRKPAETILEKLPERRMQRALFGAAAEQRAHRHEPEDHDPSRERQPATGRGHE